MRNAGVDLRQTLREEEDMVWFRCAGPDGYLIEVDRESAASDGPALIVPGDRPLPMARG